MDMGRIQQELQQRTPFKTSAEEAMVGLLRTTDVARRQLTAVVEAHGITLQQYNVLRILRGGGDQGVPTLEVGARMIEETPGTTRLLDRLEAKELVRRERCKQDRRQHLCWITKQGTTLLKKLEQPMQAAGEAVLHRLTHQDRLELIRLLDAVRASQDSTTTPTS